MKNDAPERTLSHFLYAVLIAGLGLPGLISAAETITCEAPVLTATSPEAHAQLGWSLSADGNWLAAGANLDDASGTDSGAVALYLNPRPGAKPNQEIPPPAVQAGDQFGFSVSISGEWLAVGAPMGDGKIQDSGVVYLFRLDGSTWVFKDKLDAADAAQGKQFGFSVSLSGNRLVVGAPIDSGRGSSAGAAYVFELEAGSWKQTAKLLADDGRPFDELGSSVAVAGDEIVVGAPFADELTGFKNFGAAYVFKRTANGGWTLEEKGKLTAGAFRPGNIQFGSAVAIEEGRIVVGAPGDDRGFTDSGSAYVFERNGADWTSHLLLPEDPGQSQQFGTAVQIDGNRVLIGAPFDGGSAGAAYLFERQSNASWKPKFKIRHEPGGAFGQSVAILDDQVFLGGFQYDVPLEAGPATDAGAVATCSLGVTPTSCADSITKTDQRDTVQPGQTVTYRIDIVGARPGTTVNDTFPPKLEGVGWCRGADCTDFVQQPLADTLPTGGDPTYRVRGRVRDGATGTFTNTACVNGDACLQACASDTDTIQSPVSREPFILIEKDDGLTQVSPGQTVKYTITVSNIGNGNAPAVHVTDIFPPELTGGSLLWCNLRDDPGCTHPVSGNIDQTISLAPSQRVVFTASGTVVANACGPLTNQACAQQLPGDPTCADDTPDRITQTVDLALTDPSATCGSIGYTLVVTNPGLAANGVQVTARTPAGLTLLPPTDTRCGIASGDVVCTLGTVAAGAVIRIPVAFKVPECYAGVNPIPATAVLGTSCNPLLVPRSISVPVVCKADLAVEKTGPSSVAPGDPLPYSLKVTNLGPDPACGVVVKDPIPPGLGSPSAPGCLVILDGVNEIQCPIDKLPAGQSSTFGVTFTVPPAAACDSKIVNTVSVTARTGDPQAGNDSGTAMTTVACVLPLVGVKGSCDGIAGSSAEGGMVTYTFLLANNGPAAQADNPGNEFTDVLPAGLTLVSASASSGTASTAGNTATWNGPIPVGGTVTITVVATIDLGTLGQTICNPAETAFDADGNGFNESSGTVSPACCFRVGADIPIPTLSGAGLAALSLLLAGLAVLRLRRQSL
ncbi:MAG: hypothetical protein QOF89_413 [Acidobacteriota bacterium]|jgi:uncharacterized repeat protein (TIGR01451 family)|nr:hypothetical protein [Acidobacteriota bacterium]